jgi:hypothetical protein
MESMPRECTTRGAFSFNRVKEHLAELKMPHAQLMFAASPLLVAPILWKVISNP